MSKKLNIGIIGCGNIMINHAKALENQADRFQVAAVCDPHRPAAESLAARFGLPAARVFDDVEKITALPDLDALLISTPHDRHYPHTRLALESGKHVLVEKPFTHTAAQAVELVELAEKNGLQLAVGHCQRHSPAGLAIKRLLDRGDIGRVFAAATTSLQYLPKYVSPDSGHWLYSAEKAGGGIVISVCVHKIDLLRFLFGEAESVSAFFETDPARSSATRPFEWTASVQMKFRNGALASLFSCYKAVCDSAVWMPETLQLFGSEGSLRATGWEDFEIFSQKIPEWGQSFIRHRPVAKWEWETQLDAFYESITEGKPNSADGRDAIGTMRLIDAIYESGANGGQIVTL